MSYSAIYEKKNSYKNSLPLFCLCMIDAICSKSSEPNSSHFSSREDHKVDVAASKALKLTSLLTLHKKKQEVKIHRTGICLLLL